MYTSALMVALIGLAPATDSVSKLAWQTDYALARKQSASENKPLAVVVGSGAEGWQQLSRNGGLSLEVRQMLADQYICVYLDLDTEYGRQLADVFEMTGKGLIISDRTGALQAFRQEGTVGNADLLRNLRRFSNPDHVVTTTESNLQTRVSFYGPANPGAAGANPFAPNCQGGR